MSEHPTSPTAFSALFEKKQEPVKIFQYNCLCGRTMKFESEHGVVAPQRTWQGLTDEEIKTICSENGWDSSWQSLRFAQAIEAKLKEKNT